MLASAYPRKPSEASTREQAVTAYTLTSAYADFCGRKTKAAWSKENSTISPYSRRIFLKFRLRTFPRRSQC